SAGIGAATTLGRNANAPIMHAMPTNAETPRAATCASADESSKPIAKGLWRGRRRRGRRHRLTRSVCGADVDNHGSRFDVLRADEVGSADCGDQQVAFGARGGEVGGAGVAHAEHTLYQSSGQIMDSSASPSPIPRMRTSVSPSKSIGSR